MRLITLSDIFDAMERGAGFMALLMFLLGAVFGIGLARIVMTLASIQ